MFSHVFIGINDWPRSLAFYQAVLAELGLQQKFQQPERPWAGWFAPGTARPLLVIARPYDGAPASPGNGQMIALTAASRAQVRRLHQLALQHGGSCAGAAGLRPEYHADFYGCYVRDPDGNKLAFCCHHPEPD